MTLFKDTTKKIQKTDTDSLQCKQCKVKVRTRHAKTKLCFACLNIKLKERKNLSFNFDS